jgi:hypothetical protein
MAYQSTSGAYWDSVVSCSAATRIGASFAMASRISKPRIVIFDEYVGLQVKIGASKVLASSLQKSTKCGRAILTLTNSSANQVDNAFYSLIVDGAWLDANEAEGHAGCAVLERLGSTRKFPLRALRPTKNG